MMVADPTTPGGLNPYAGGGSPGGGFRDYAQTGGISNPFNPAGGSQYADTAPGAYSAFSSPGGGGPVSYSPNMGFAALSPTATGTAATPLNWSVDLGSPQNMVNTMFAAPTYGPGFNGLTAQQQRQGAPASSQPAFGISGGQAI